MNTAGFQCLDNEDIDQLKVGNLSWRLMRVFPL